MSWTAYQRYGVRFAPRTGLRLAILFVAAFVLRLGAGQLLAGGLGGPYQGDEADYATLAVRIVQGQGLTSTAGLPTSMRTPGLPFLLAVPIGVTGPNTMALRLFMSLIGSLLVPACYLLCRSLTGSPTLGLIAAGIAVIFPSWVIPSSSILSDIPTTISVTLMVWVLIESYKRQAVIWAVAAGVLLGIATLMRPVSLVYGPAVAFWLLLVMRRWTAGVAAGIVVLTACACVLAPWSLRNLRVHGAVVITSTLSGLELFKANNPDATGILAIDHAYFDAHLARRYPEEQYPNEAVRSSRFRAAAVEFIQDNPARFSRLCLIRLVQLWKIYSPRVPLSNNLAVAGSFGLALPLFFVQVARRGWRRGPEMLFVLIIASHTVAHMVYTSSVRYRVPIEPLVVVAAIAGCHWLVAWFQCRRLPIPSSQIGLARGLSHDVWNDGRAG
jgi:4-amino-4-deoxy-L-arabinose transferase-like glycosyltransferase